MPSDVSRLGRPCLPFVMHSIWSQNRVQMQCTDIAVDHGSSGNAIKQNVRQNKACHRILQRLIVGSSAEGFKEGAVVFGVKRLGVEALRPYNLNTGMHLLLCLHIALARGLLDKVLQVPTYRLFCIVAWDPAVNAVSS